MFTTFDFKFSGSREIVTERGSFGAKILFSYKTKEDEIYKLWSARSVGLLGLPDWFWFDISAGV